MCIQASKGGGGEVAVFFTIIQSIWLKKKKIIMFVTAHGLMMFKLK